LKMEIDLDSEYDNQDAAPAAPAPEAAIVADPVVESSDVETETKTPDDEVFSPTWFSEIQEAMANPILPGPVGPPMQMPPPPPPGYPPQPPPQYQQPPQQGRDPRYQDIDQLFENPRQYVASILNQGMQQYQQQYIGQTQQDIARVMHANATNAMYNAKQAIDRGYEEVLNKDNSFRGNSSVRDIVNGTLKTMSLRAANAAYNGDFNQARQFENPRFYAALVSAAKQLAGVQGVASEPAVPVGAVGEGSTSSRFGRGCKNREQARFPREARERLRGSYAPWRHFLVRKGEYHG
jgi:hypothetical protein